MSSSLTPSTITTSGAISTNSTYGFGYSSVPTLSSSQCGYSLTSTTLLTTSVSTTATQIMSLTIPAVGVWLISCALTLYGSGTGIYCYSTSNSTAAVQTIGNPTSSYCCLTPPSHTYTCTTANTTIYVMCQNNGNTNTVFQGFYQATRIA